VATARKEAESGSLDQALLRRVAAGDESALAALYDRYAGVVYSVTNRILRDTGAAEEVVQDIFYQLWRSASQFDFARGSLPAWLLVIARNRAIDRLRGRSRKLLEETEYEPVATALGLDTSAAQAEAMSKVTAALGALPASQREALELAYFEGLTHTEIADRTGEPLGTIKTRLRTAVQSLKRALNP
jgi:RNA polymerase sigma-70 factor, ECF subfamily